MRVEVIEEFGIEGKIKRFKKGETLEVKKGAVIHDGSWVCDVDSPFFKKHLKSVVQLHKFLRDIRIERGELLKDMADKLGMGSAELSAIEHGRKPIPEGFMQKIQDLYFVGGQSE